MSTQAGYGILNWIFGRIPSIEKAEYPVRLSKGSKLLTVVFADSVDVLQRLELQQKLAFHSGCVNTIGNYGCVPPTNFDPEI